MPAPEGKKKNSYQVRHSKQQMGCPQQLQTTILEPFS